MEHRLVTGIQKALGWDGPGPMGSVFSRGALEDSRLIERLMTPYRLLEVVRTRHRPTPNCAATRRAANSCRPRTCRM